MPATIDFAAPVLPPAPIGDGWYRLYWIHGAEDELLYVGITSRPIHQRLAEHRRTKLHTRAHREAARFERDVIRARRPRFNLINNQERR